MPSRYKASTLRRVGPSKASMQPACKRGTKHIVGGVVFFSKAVQFGRKAPGDFAVGRRSTHFLVVTAAAVFDESSFAASLSFATCCSLRKGDRIVLAAKSWVRPRWFLRTACVGRRHGLRCPFGSAGSAT